MLLNTLWLQVEVVVEDKQPEQEVEVAIALL
jgi:hypothetical protein